jgi:hypothetical protein
VATSASAYLLSVRPAKGVTVVDSNPTEKIRHFLFPHLSGRRPREHATRLTADQPVTTWLLWQFSGPDRGTEVLRATFRDGRLARIEYESFGDDYQRLIKGDHPIPMDADEITRLWRRAARVDQAEKAVTEPSMLFTGSCWVCRSG